MLTQFRNHYPHGSLISELITIDRGQYIVKATIQVNGVILSTGLAAADQIETAEDNARERALLTLVLDSHPEISSSPSPEQESEVSSTNQTKTVTTRSSGFISNKSQQLNKSNLVNLSLRNHSTPLSQLTQIETEADKIESIEVQQTPKVSNPDTTKEIKSEVKQTPSWKDETSSNLVSSNSVESSTIPQFISSSPTTEIDEVDTELLQKKYTAFDSSPKDLPLSSPSLSSEDLSSQTTQVQLDLSHSEVTSTPTTESEEFDFNEIIDRTDVEIKRLGWTKDQGRDFLLQSYGKRSRIHLTNEELMDFLHYLESQPNPT